MENIITKIIEIDQQANEKLAASRAEKDTMLAKAQKDALSSKQTLMQQADKRIAEVESFHLSEYERESALRKQEYEHSVQEIDAVFAAKHLEFENTIFQRIVGE